MRLGTIISIVASAVLAIGALLIARLWLPNHASHTAQAQTANQVENVPVVVAAVPIPWGAKLDGHYLKVAKIPPEDRPQGAYANVGQILNQDGGPPVALQAMATQEPVLVSKLTGPGRAADAGRPGRARHARLHDRRHGGDRRRRPHPARRPRRRPLFARAAAAAGDQGHLELQAGRRPRC